MTELKVVKAASEVVVLVTVTVTGSLIVDVTLVVPDVVLVRFKSVEVAVAVLVATLDSVVSDVDVAEAKLEEANVLE